MAKVVVPVAIGALVVKGVRTLVAEEDSGYIDASDEEITAVSSDALVDDVSQERPPPIPFPHLTRTHGSLWSVNKEFLEDGASVLPYSELIKHRVMLIAGSVSNVADSAKRRVCKSTECEATLTACFRLGFCDP